MQQTNGVAVVATQLAGVDRRSLSQAWYSALHLAERQPAARHAPLSRGVERAGPHGSRAARNPNDAARQSANDDARGIRGAARATTARFDAGAAGAERRGPRTDLARRIEHGLTRRPPRGAAASFAVRCAGGRVHLLVRGDGARTRVVAVCAPPLRERVERALAQARFVLAGHGIRAEAA